MTEAEVYVDKDKYVISIIILLWVIAFIGVANACETKRVYLPDGTMQVCQVCKDVVVCY